MKRVLDGASLAIILSLFGLAFGFAWNVLNADELHKTPRHISSDIKNYPRPLICYPVIEDGGVTRYGKPVILLWANVIALEPQLVFTTIDGKIMKLPSDSYVCKQQ